MSPPRANARNNKRNWNAYRHNHQKSSPRILHIGNANDATYRQKRA
jgi:hypothetical protein